MEWFANDFHSWLRHLWKLLANRLTRDPKIVIHGNLCIILYISTCNMYQYSLYPTLIGSVLLAANTVQALHDWCGVKIGQTGQTWWHSRDWHWDFWIITYLTRTCMTILGACISWWLLYHWFSIWDLRSSSHVMALMNSIDSPWFFGCFHQLH